MNVKKSQSYIDLTVRNWDNTEFGSTLREMCEAAREYENDQVEVHQVVNLGKRKGEWHYLIILNISQDLDNLGALVESNYR
ncbi:hypothetical protein ABFY54_00550 [Priestia megaterium]|uniref:Uncharacterized protein n=1 Tax=Priestia megaterium Q3 TaxID=1452722 RepID=A0A806TFA0_PRIMG|nr:MULTISPECIES: hypothetical protein [Priestia]AKP76771.1 hypothetical protein AS52_01806 [Priestia megaterium Q3]MED3887696.1 hypothetical protein [Priestia aryabhattai]MED4000301.1 hypothetical protein [Priestia aryabhattai]MED4258141.1 hypothetical protein [Priestia aryabhattai]NGY85463.1 hypothetical protein [Priestia megaterium]